MAPLAAAAAASAACSSSAIVCSEAFRARCNAAASASPAFPSLSRSRSSRLAAVRASSRWATAAASAAAEEKSSGEAARAQTVVASKVASSVASVLSGSALLQLTVLAAPALATYEAPAGLTDDQWVEAAIYFVLIFGGYLFVAPPLIYNYLRVRWYNRSMPETFFQYWLMFTFFPGMLLWAPFINFRRFPRDSV